VLPFLPVSASAAGARVCAGPAYVSIRQHTSAYVSMHPQLELAYAMVLREATIVCGLKLLSY
jgi:hypothetical protein